MSELARSTQVLDLSPKTFEEAWKFCEIVTSSGLAPKGFEKKPNDAFIAIQWGAEVGLKPLQALQNIAVINGRPSLWGDAVIALVRASPLCEYIRESDDGNTATCRAKRRGNEEEVRTFSMEDAKTAGLSGKQGPWTTNPKRMRQMRARAFALRDVFADVLKGMPIAEEVMDFEEKDITPAKTFAKIEQLYISEEQLEELRLKILDAGLSESDFCAHKAINIESIDKLPAARFDAAIKKLDVKIAELSAVVTQEASE